MVGVLNPSRRVSLSKVAGIQSRSVGSQIYSRRILLKLGVATVLTRLWEPRGAFASSSYRETIEDEDKTCSDVLKRYKAFSFSSNGNSRTVFYLKNGPPVLILHEVTGLTPECVKLSERIYQGGFSPVIPLLFGDACYDYGSLSVLRIIFNADFSVYAAQRSHPILPWLQDLVDSLPSYLSAHSGAIGVIGMCLTGMLPIALLSHQSVVAPIVCHPTVPFPLFPGSSWRAHELGISVEELDAAKTRASNENIPILGFSFRDDWRCPPARFDRLKDEFPHHFVPCVLPSQHNGDHAVFTGSYVDRPGSSTNNAFLRMLAFLKRRLT